MIYNISFVMLLKLHTSLNGIETPQGKRKGGRHWGHGDATMQEELKAVTKDMV